jgi:hypothetical protein
MLFCNSIRFSLILACISMLASCASHSWRIVLRDGREMTAISQPVLQTKTGYYRFHNDRDRDALLREDEVLLIEQVR